MMLFICVGCFDGLTVFISVSAIASKSRQGVLQDRLIEINWNNADPEPQDWVWVQKMLTFYCYLCFFFILSGWTF